MYEYQDPPPFDFTDMHEMLKKNEPNLGYTEYSETSIHHFCWEI